LKRIAVISDIHGNSFALEAVKADIERRRVDRIVNVGDSVFGPLDPTGTADQLLEMDCISISGNHDRVLWSPTEAAEKSSTYCYVTERLTKKHMNWLKSLPDHVTVADEIFVCHGTPTSDERYLLEKVTRSGVQLNSEQDIAKSMEGCEFPILLCGHTHIPRVVYLLNGTTVVNPGSVGLPAYDDEQPVPHKMETGSPHARYAVVTRHTDHWSIEQIVIEYDWEKAAALAEKNGRMDWARALLTGRV
jgi:putative phosphoesterase